MLGSPYLTHILGFVAESVAMAGQDFQNNFCLLAETH